MNEKLTTIWKAGGPVLVLLSMSVFLVVRADHAWTLEIVVISVVLYLLLQCEKNRREDQKVCDRKLTALGRRLDDRIDQLIEAKEQS